MDFTDKLFKKDSQLLEKYEQQLSEFLDANADIDKENDYVMEKFNKELSLIEDSIAKVKNRLIKTFEKCFKEGFELSGQDCARMLDVTESYLFLKLKDKIDYIKPPRAVTDFFKAEIRSIEKQIEDLEFKIRRQEREPSKIELEKVKNWDHQIQRFKFLSYKKVFINKNSVREFLKAHGIVMVQRVQVVINQNELEHEINSRIATRVLKQLSNHYELKAKERKKSIKNDEVDSSLKETKLTDEVIEKLLDRKMRLYSPRSIKEVFVKENLRQLDATVHDAQLYRFLDNKSEYTKINITSTLNKEEGQQKQSAIRYLLELEIQLELFIKDQEQQCIVFSVPVGEYHDGIKDEAIDLINEAMQKYHDRESKKKNQK